MEIWKDIPEYDGIYKISNYGNIISLAKNQNKLMKINNVKNGYSQIVLYKNGIKKTHLVHRLVMYTFIGYSELEVNHINGDKYNNRLENLEYCNRSQNAKHAYEIGLQKPLRGDKVITSKLKEHDIIEIFKLRHSGFSHQFIADKLNVSRKCISKILNRKSWTHINIITWPPNHPNYKPNYPLGTGC